MLKQELKSHLAFALAQAKCDPKRHFNYSTICQVLCREMAFFKLTFPKEVNMEIKIHFKQYKLRKIHFILSEKAIRLMFLLLVVF